MLLLLSLGLVVALAGIARARHMSVWTEFAAWLVLGLLAVGFHWRLVAGDAYAPAGGGDLASFLYPYYVYAAQSLRAGEIPLWNPYAFSGMPFVGDVQNGLCYPINLLLFLIKPDLQYTDLEALAIGHLWLAGGLTYTALRHWPGLGVGRGAALLGAVAFMFSDLFVMHFGNLNMIAVAAWLPLVLVLFALALERHSFAWAGWSGAALGVSALAGHIQPTIYNGLALALLAAQGACRAQPALRERLRPFALLAVAGVVAICLSAPTTFPALVLSEHTPRTDFTYWDASRYSLSPFRALGLLLPDLTGRDPADYWGLGDRVETGYLGLLPLLLAGLALWRLRDRRWVVLFGGLAAITFAVALGDNLPLHGWLYALIPGLDLLRAPARALYLTDFALAALAAIAAQAIVTSGSGSGPQVLRRYLGAVARGAVVAAPLFLATALLAVLLMQDRDPVIFSRAWQALGSVSRTVLFLAVSLLVLRAAPSLGGARARTWLAAALVVTFLDLASVGAYVDLGAANPAQGFERGDAVAFLRSDPNPFRVDVDPSAAAIWPPNLGLVHRIDHVRGVANPMELTRYSQFLHLASDRGGALYRLLGAKYLVMAKGHSPGETGFRIAFGGDPEVDLYLNTGALPLISVVGRSLSVDGPAGAAAAISAEGFDPTAVVVLEGNAPLTVSATSARELSFADRTANRMTLAVSVAEPSYLLVSVPFAPGWRATVDGVGAEIYPADLAWSAVYLSAGQHRVALSFMPPLFAPALALAGAAVLGVTLLTTRAAFAGKRRLAERESITTASRFNAQE